MKTQFQNLTEYQQKYLLNLLQKNEELFDGTLGTWGKYPVCFKLKENFKPICSQPYPVLKIPF